MTPRKFCKFSLSICFVLVLAACGASAPATAAVTTHADASRGAPWRHPLQGEWVVTRGFQAPTTTYGPGHRGVDLRAEVGTPVFAPRDAVVSFAGEVATIPVLSLKHDAGWVTSFEAVQASVAAGDAVAAGQLVGTVAQGPHCSCLHFSARYAGAYVNPLLLYRQIPAAVLLPW